MALRWPYVTGESSTQLSPAAHYSPSALRDARELNQLLAGCPFAAHTTRNLSTEPLQLQASQHAGGNITQVDPTLLTQISNFQFLICVS